MSCAAPAPSTSARLCVRIDALLIVLVGLVVAGLNLRWAMSNSAPPRGDDNTHLLQSAIIFDRMAHSQDYGQAMRLYFLQPGHYPPLVYQVTLVFYRMFGNSVHSAILSLTPFLLLLGLSMYGIGEFIGGRSLGLACAFMSMTSPITVECARRYFLDMPVTALLACAVCCLMRCDFFRNRTWSLCFGVALGLGFLAKWVMLIYILPVFVWVLMFSLLRSFTPGWKAFAVAAAMAGIVTLVICTVIAHSRKIPIYDDADPRFDLRLYAIEAALFSIVVEFVRRALDERGRRPIFNMIQAFLLTGAIMWPWYFFNCRFVIDKVLYQAGVEVSWTSVAMKNALDLGFVTYLAPVLLLPGVLFGLWRRARRAWVAVILCAFVTGYLFDCGLPPDTRYVLPLIVFVVPLAFGWLAVLPRWSAGVVVGLFLAVGLYQSAGFLIATPPYTTIEEEHLYIMAQAAISRSLIPLQPTAPESGEFPYDKLLSCIRWNNWGPTWLGVLAKREDAAVLQPRSLPYYAELRGRRLLFIDLIQAVEAGQPPTDLRQCHEFLLEYRDRASRDELIERAVQLGWLPGFIHTDGKFTFPTDFVLELVSCP